MSVLWGHESRHSHEGEWHNDVGAVEKGVHCDMCDEPLSYPYICVGDRRMRVHPACGLSLIKRISTDVHHALMGIETERAERAGWMLDYRGRTLIREQQAVMFWNQVTKTGGFSLNFLIDWLRQEDRFGETLGVESYLREEAAGLAAILTKMGCIEQSGRESYRLTGRAPDTVEQEREERRQIRQALRLLEDASGSSAPPRVIRDPQRSFSRLQKEEIYRRADGHCVGCGRPLDSDWHADHIFPHSRGGRTETVNGQALCQPCNSRKHAKVLTVDGGEG